MRLHKHDPEFHLAAVADPEKNERSTSQSNGSLMRAVPLALWAHARGGRQTRIVADSSECGVL
jgi:ADP-ribosylglycohydrolase